jgi:MFS family permease
MMSVTAYVGEGRYRPRLAALSLAMLLPSLGTSITNVTLPTLAGSFDATMADVQWVAIAYLLSVTSLIVGAGRLGDLVGRRLLLLAGIAIFSAASAICALSPGLVILIAARAVQGVGGAVMMTLTVAMVGDLVPKDRTGSAMGLLGTVSAVGTALGPTLGGVLIAGSGWASVFVVLTLRGIFGGSVSGRFEITKGNQ